ncbi:hypothetical protein LXL04_025219 [Taraxacum kok-saghyz]
MTSFGFHSARKGLKQLATDAMLSLFSYGRLVVIIVIRTSPGTQLSSLTPGKEFLLHLSYIEIYNKVMLMTPVGALSIKVSVVHAHFLLNGKLRKVGILGCMLCIMGSTVILHVPAEHSIIDVSALFLLDIKCRVLVWPNYLGDVSATESERFFTKLIEKQVFKHYFEKLEE